MALHLAKKEDIPKDAVVITRDEAYIYNMKLIDTWSEATDVWALRLGSGILGGFTAVTAMYVNSFYRQKVKLGNWGQMSSYLPTVVIPTIMTLVFQKDVTKTMILSPRICSACLQMRAAASQVFTGVAYPSVMAPLAAFMYATKYFTMRLPSLTAKPKEVLLVYRKMTKPLVSPLVALIALHGLTAVFITYKEQEQFINMHLKMLDIENKIENQ